MRLRRRRAMALGVLVWCAVVTGCATGPQSAYDTANAAYDRGDYATALSQARKLAGASGHAPLSLQAAYLAGLSAHRLNDLAAAEKYLLLAAASGDRALAADALADLGLVYAQQKRYLEAVEAFTKAADQSTGLARANALLYAGLSQQKLSQWAAARTSFALARTANPDPAFGKIVSNHQATTGYTIQVGAFGEEANARKAAQGLGQRAAELKLGLPRVVSSVDAQGRRLYLVHLGAFSSFDVADAWRKQLAAAGGLVTPLKQ